MVGNGLYEDTRKAVGPRSLEVDAATGFDDLSLSLTSTRELLAAPANARLAGS